MRMHSTFCALCLSLVCGLFAFAAAANAPDKAGDRKRELLANVRRVAIVTPFYGTATLDKTEPSEKKPDDKSPSEKKPNPPLEAYREQLRQLEARARACLPARVAARAPFEIVPEEEQNAAFKELELSPQKLFQNKGKMRGARFPLPETEAARKLAERLKADAVLLCVMDEPRRSNGQYYFTPLGLAYDPGHVRSKAGFYILLPDGTEVMRAYVESLHPLTTNKGRDYLLVDWRETLELVIENFLDELTRYTPEKKSGD